MNFNYFLKLFVFVFLHILLDNRQKIQTNQLYLLIEIFILTIKFIKELYQIFYHIFLGFLSYKINK
jgi:hypothetical protein